MKNTLHSNREAKTERGLVLVVDDEVELVEIVSIALSDAGYRCLTAVSAAEALSVLTKTPSIDVVISDVRMPDMDGIELLKTIRQRFYDRSSLQVMFLTGHASVDSTVAALRLSAADFLSKPIRRDELVSAVEQAVVRAQAQGQRQHVWKENMNKLEELLEEARSLAKAIDGERLPASLAVQPPHPTGASSKVPARSRLIEILRMRDVRSHFFEDKLFADPVLHMLFDLMENRLLKRQLSVSQLGVSAGVPLSTAMRRLDDLERIGYIERWDDPRDGRRQLVKLTDNAADKIAAYLVALDRKLH